MTTNDIIENKELQNKLIDRCEVLDKVKSLLLIPNTNYATLNLVADFYEVDNEIIRKLVQRNKKELKDDGLLSYSGKQIKELLGQDIMSSRNINGGFELNNIMFNYNKNTIFPRRAILRVGMLLRDSEIAKEVRTQLLNIEEQTDPIQKVAAIDNEEDLLKEVGRSIMTGDLMSLAASTTKLMDFKNRHIKQLTDENNILQDKNDLLQNKNNILQNDNKALSNGILEWSDRSKLNAGIRHLSKVTHIHYGNLWNELYKQLKYGYHIDLKSRANKDYISTVKENEWEAVVKSFSAICESYEQSPTEMINSSKK